VNTSRRRGTAHPADDRDGTPFTVNGFLSGSGSVNGQAATWIRQDQRAGVSFTGPHPRSRPDTRAAAGQQPRLLADRLSHPDHHPPFTGRTAHHILARQQPRRHPQAPRRPPRNRHLHHDLHGAGPAPLSQWNRRTRPILRLAADHHWQLARPLRAGAGTRTTLRRPEQPCTPCPKAATPDRITCRRGPSKRHP
jgi:hypothetical protein